MPIKTLLATFLVACSAVGLGYLLTVDNPGQFDWFAATVPPAPTPTASSLSPPPPNASTQPGPAENSLPPDNAVAFMLARVADQYAENARYPEYSVPLSDEQAKAYQGNQFHPVKLPLADGSVFTVTLEKFRFTQGEDILVVATLNGTQVVRQQMSATLESTGSRDVHADATLHDNRGDRYFEGVIEADASPGEYRLVVEASVDGRPLRHVSTLSIEPDLGDFEGLGSPGVSGNNLVIPIKFKARESGYYALSAQLHGNGRAIAQLSTEKRLDTSSNVLELKAHGSVLAKRNISGKLTLKGLQIRRLPAKPGDRTDYAFGPEDGYSFTPPSLDSLTNSPAGDPESEQRAALLRKLASKF